MIPAGTHQPAHTLADPLAVCTVLGIGQRPWTRHLPWVRGLHPGSRILCTDIYPTPVQSPKRSTGFPGSAASMRVSPMPLCFGDCSGSLSAPHPLSPPHVFLAKWNFDRGGLCMHKGGVWISRQVEQNKREQGRDDQVRASGWRCEWKVRRQSPKRWLIFWYRWWIDSIC